MRITLNSNPIELQEPCSLAQLKETQGLPQSNIAIALNERVIPASRHSETFLKEGDEVVAIGAAYGG